MNATTHDRWCARLGKTPLRCPKGADRPPDAGQEGRHMAKQRKQERKIDGRTAPAKRRRALIAAYEAQIGTALSPATRSLIARTVAIEITLEAMEADQI